MITLLLFSSSCLTLLETVLFIYLLHPPFPHPQSARRAGSFPGSVTWHKLVFEKLVYAEPVQGGCTQNLSDSQEMEGQYGWRRVQKGARRLLSAMGGEGWEPREAMCEKDAQEK